MRVNTELVRNLEVERCHSHSCEYIGFGERQSRSSGAFFINNKLKFRIVRRLP